MDKITKAPDQIQPIVCWCGSCGNSIGVGKGKRAGAQLRKCKVKVDAPLNPVANGAIVTATVFLCLTCLETVTNALIKAKSKQILIPGKLN